MGKRGPPITITNPELVGEWSFERNDPLGPEDVSKYAKKSVWWKCSTCSNEWKNSIQNRAYSNNGCPYCGLGRPHSDGRNSLEKRNPVLASEWHPIKNGELLPSQVTLNHNKKVWWFCNKSKCEHPHEWQAAPNNRASNGAGCPFCNGNHSFCPCDSIANTDPELAAQLHPDEKTPATKLSRKSMKKVLWLCPNSTCEHEHSWYSTVSNRTKGQGCPFCSIPAKSFCICNSFGTLYPDKALQWSDRNGEMTPHDVSPGSRKKVWWKCDKGPDHEWYGAVADRTRKDQHGGCPYCSNPPRLVSVTNSLATKNPEVVAFWHTEKNQMMEPSDVFPSSVKKVWWKCDKGPDHEWLAAPEKMVAAFNSEYAGIGCPYCNGRKVSITNRLDLLRPELVAEWHPTKNGEKIPSDFTVSSNKNVWWLCGDCGREWRSNINNRSKGQGCSACADYGFNPSKPAYYYAMEIRGPTGVWWYKGGIAADPEGRRYHVEWSMSDNGLPLEVKLLDTRRFDRGKDARTFERLMLQIGDIRVETPEKFDGCQELFEVNPLEYALENGLLEKDPDHIQPM